MFSNEQIVALLEDQKKISNIKEKIIEKPSLEEKEKRKELVKLQKEKFRMQEQEKERLKQEQQEIKQERLRQLDATRKIIETQMPQTEKKKVIKKKKIKKKTVKESDELNPLKLNQWLISELRRDDTVTESDENLDQNIIIPKKRSVSKCEQFIPEPPHENPMQAKRNSLVKKAEMIRQNKLNDKAALIISDAEKRKMADQMQVVQDKLNKIKLNSNSNIISSVEASNLTVKQEQIFKRDEAVITDFPELQEPKTIVPKHILIQNEENKIEQQPVISILKNNNKVEEKTIELPGTTSLREQIILEKEKTENQKVAATEIQRHLRGFFVRKGIKEFKKECESIEEQIAYTSKQTESLPHYSSLAANKVPQYSDSHKTIPFVIQAEKDPYSVVNIFINRNKELLQSTNKNEEKSAIKPEDSIKQANLITESVPEEIESSNLKKSVREVQQSIPEEVVKESVKEEKKEEIQESAKEEKKEETIESIKEEISEEKIDNIKTIKQNEVIIQNEEKKIKGSEELLEKFIEVTKDMQTQHNQQINIVIDKLCGHLQKLAQPTLVQMSQPLPMENIAKPQIETKKVEESNYAADFEEYSQTLPPKNITKKAEELNESIKEEIVETPAKSTKELAEETPAKSIKEDIEEKPAESIKEEEVQKTSIPEEIPALIEEHQNSSPKEEKVHKESITEDIPEEVEVEEEPTEKDNIAKTTGSARLILGSEKTVREQSQRIIEESIEEDIEEKKEEDPESIFDHNSFSEFTYKKFKEVLKNSNIESIMKLREEAAKKRFDEKQKEIKEQIRTQQLSPRTSKRKEKDLETWYNNEKASLKAERKSQEASALRTTITLIEQIEKDKERTKKLMKTDKQVEESRDTIRTESISEIPEIEKEIEELRKAEPKQTAEMRRKEIIKKRMASEKLMMEKKKAIEEGVKDKVLRAEEEEADRVFQAAMQFDVKTEIENRAKQAVDIIKSKKEIEIKRPIPEKKQINVKEKIEEQSIQEEIIVEKKPSTSLVKDKAPDESIQEEIIPEKKPTTSFVKDKTPDESIQEVIVPEKRVDKNQEVDVEMSIKEDIIAQSINDDVEKLKEKKKAKTPEKKPVEAPTKINNPEESIGEDIIAQSIKADEKPIIEIKKEPQVIPENNKPTEPIEESIKEDVIAQSNISIKESIAESNDKQKISKQNVGQEEYSMSFEQMSQAEASKNSAKSHKNQDPQLSKKQSAEEILSDSQKKMFSSSEDVEANTGSEVDWVAAIGDSQSITNREEEKKDTKLTSVQEQKSDDEESKQEIAKLEEESIKSEIQENYEDNYEDDFENPSSGSKTPKDIKGRTEGLNSPADEQNHSGSDSVKLKLSLEKVENVEPEIKKQDISENKPVEIEEEKKEELDPIKIEEEKQRKKIAEAYARKEREELNKRADKLTDIIIEELLGKIQDNLVPSRKEIEKEVKELTQPNIEPKEKMPPGIKSTVMAVEHYIDDVFTAIQRDAERFVQNLSQPLNRDPLLIMGQIQNEEADYFAGIEQIVSQPVLPVDLYLEIERSRKIEGLSDKAEDKHHEALLTEWSNIHNKCIFDAINDALDYYRPYGIKGPPLPWSKHTRELTFRNGTVSSIREILGAVKSKVIEYLS